MSNEQSNFAQYAQIMQVVEKGNNLLKEFESIINNEMNRFYVCLDIIVKNYRQFKDLAYGENKLLLECFDIKHMTQVRDAYFYVSQMHDKYKFDKINADDVIYTFTGGSNDLDVETYINIMLYTTEEFIKAQLTFLDKIEAIETNYVNFGELVEKMIQRESSNLNFLRFRKQDYNSINQYDKRIKSYQQFIKCFDESIKLAEEPEAQETNNYDA